MKSFTEPEHQILDYSPWWLKTKHGVKPVEIDDAQRHSNGWVVHIKGIDDRDLAAALTPVDIAVEKALLPDLDEGEFYWHQLIGLTVVSEFEGETYHLGVVEQMLETGANDVLVVKASSASIDERERLVPYVPDIYVIRVDTEKGEIRVEWDPAF